MAIYTLREYAEHLALAGLRIEPKMISTMRRAGLNIRDDWRDRAAGKNPVHARKYASTIVMRRVIVVDGNVTVTVEPLGRGQGKLGTVLEYGGGRNAPQRSHEDALDAELPKLLEWLARIAVEPLR